MQDRLNDLYNVRTSKDFTESEMVDVPIDVDELDVPAGLQDFTLEVDNLKLAITQLKSNIETLTSGYRSVLTSTDTTSIEQQNSESEKQIEVTMKQIGDGLKKMSVDNETTTDHTRWKKNVHSHLTKRFMDTMIQYRGLQSEHQEKIQERIRQRLRIVKPDATPDQIQNVVDGGKMNVFAEQLYAENSAQAREALTYVEGRHRELLKIEESVNELHRLFCDMALLVNAQGSFIDNIENNVAATGAYVEQGNKDLIQANRRASKRRWCKFGLCISLIVLLAIAIIIFIVFGVSKNWWKSPVSV